jgi:hypothetical protein
MNCQVVQNKILALPDPRLVPDPLRNHFIGCAACQAWAKQVARLETLLEQLPAPPAPADKKDALIGDLTRGGAIITRPLAMPARSDESRVLTFLRRNAALVGGLAAAILVVLGAWLFFPKSGPKPDMAESLPDDPFLRKIFQRDLELAKADTPAKRLQILSGLADDLSTQARSLARVASPDELRDLARSYDKVVTVAMVEQKVKINRLAIPQAERDALLKSLAEKLGETASEADKLLGEVPPESKDALRKIANSARGGQKTLQGTTDLVGKERD